MATRNVLSTTAVAVGATIAPITFENTSTTAQTNAPVTFGQHFARGQFPKAAALVALRAPDNSTVQAQLDIKATHKDGSIKHAIISAIIPSIAGSTSVTYSIVRATSGPSGAAPVPSDFPTLRPVFSLTDNGTDVAGPTAGVQYTADGSALLAAGTYEIWLSGPLVSEWILRVPLKTAQGVEHPDLHVRFYIRVYKGSPKVKVDYIVENSWVKPKAVIAAPTPFESVSITPAIYGYSLKVNNTVVDNRAVSAYVRMRITGAGNTFSATATNLPNDSTVFTATATIDGVAKPISVTGSAAQTFEKLYALVTSQLGGLGKCTIDEGNTGIRITSNSTGLQSKVTMDYGSLIPALTATGLSQAVNDATKSPPTTEVIYTASITVGGTTKTISVAGNTSATFGKLSAAINAQLGGIAKATPQLAAPGIKFVSTATGLSTDVAVTEGTLFANTKTKVYVPYRPIRGDEHIHYPGQRWKKTYWLNGEPELHIRHDKAYLIDSMAVPNYPKSLVGDPTTIANNLAKMLSNGDIGRNGTAKQVMSDYGYANSIGIFPEWVAMYLVNQGADAKYTMLKMADLSGSWPHIRRETVTDAPIDFGKWPYATNSPSASDSQNPATKINEKLPSTSVPPSLPSSANKMDVSHHPDFHYVPYLVTGDYFYMEGMLFVFNDNALSQNAHATYRDGGKVLFRREQTRGQAWMLRSLSHCRYLLPDEHPNRPALDVINAANVTYYNSYYVDPTGAGANMFGVNDQFLYDLGGAKVAASSFMEDFVTQATGRAIELGFDEWLPMLQFKSKHIKGRLTSGPDFCWQWAAGYTLRYRDIKGGPFYTSWKQIYDNSIPYYGGQSAAVLTYACGSAEMAAALKAPVNSMGGYPSDIGGYPSNMTPATAYCAMFDMPSGKDAWLVLDSRTVKPDYNTGPQFAIEPRTFATASIPTDPDPTPDPDPQPTDTDIMAIADNVKDSTSTVGTGPFVFDGAPPINYRPWLTTPIEIGKETRYSAKHETLPEFENGVGVLTSALVMERVRVTSSSNNNNLPVNFSAGKKWVECALTADLYETLAGAHNVTTQSISEADGTVKFMVMVGTDQQPQLIEMSGVGLTVGQLALLPGGSVLDTDEFEVLRAGVNYRAPRSYILSNAPVDSSAPQFLSGQVSNATPNIILLTFNETLGPYTPAASAFSVSGGKTVTAVSRNGASLSLTVSVAYVYGDVVSVTYTKPATNPIQDATGNQTASFGPSGVVNNIAAPGDTVVPTVSAAAVANASPTIVILTASEPLDEAFIPAASAFTVSGHTVSAAGVTGSTIKLTVSAAFVNGEAARTAAYTQPGTNNVRDLAGNLLANFTGLAITNNVAAAATAPGAPTIGTAVAGDGYVDVAFTAPASNGGSAILDYTATLSTGQTATGTASPLRVTAPNGTAVTATVKARNTVGSSPASAASNSVTPVSATPAVDYNIYPYSSNTINATKDFSTFAGSGTRKYARAGNTTDGYSANIYWNIDTPTPTKAYMGFGSSATVPPAVITALQNSSAAGGSSMNGMAPMGKGTGSAWSMSTSLWVDQGSGTTVWYPWIVAEDASGNLGVPECIRPAGLTVTNA